ncbi:hypothetical protein VNI00_019240 [Paramarasmius palmivorus]|uniref:Uncharacterized protein n=1 Tax=Paramarasmius palmivorus TaxID=297713 RepID=A0AAW0AQB9_9AGAR
MATAVPPLRQILELILVKYIRSNAILLWPHDEGSWGFDDYNDSVPSTVDMLEPATFIRYLSGEATTRDKLDIQVVRGVVHQEGFMVMSVSRGWDDKIVSRSYKELETCSGPGSVPPPPLKWCKDSDGFWRRTECYGAFEFLEHLRFDAAYSPITWQEIGRVCREDLPRSSWTTSYGDIFCKKELVGELTRSPHLVYLRFSIDLEKLWTNSDTSGMPGMSIYTTGPGVLSHAWLSQASYILDENDSGDMEPYDPASANSVPYLFIRPPPLQVKDVEDWANSQISWWSFDNNGATEIPESTCQQLGLINPILDSVGVRLVHWSKPGVKAHDIIHAWQVARGFDPKTPDFARHLGFPIIERTAPRKTPKVEAVEDTNPEPELQESDSILSWWRAGRRVLKDFLTSIIV